MKKVLFTLLMLTLLSIPLRAEDGWGSQVPDLSIGINANVGTFDFYDNNLDFKTEPGLYTGGGITVEKNIYGILNLGTGVQYRYFYTEFTMTETAPETDVRWTFQSINIPFVMILSFSGGESALNLSAGAVYSNVFYSVAKGDTGTSKENDNVLRITNTNQAGVTAGITFKVRVTKYTDFVFGVTGEYYPSNLLYNTRDSGDEINMFNYSLTTGYMFRTDLFPGSKN